MSSFEGQSAFRGVVPTYLVERHAAVGACSRGKFKTRSPITLPRHLGGATADAGDLASK